MIGLIDCNNFYVSCERVFNPGLNGRPVVVLSNNDGAVISRSQEIKDLGIPMGAPLFEYKEILEKEKAVIFSSNYPLYGDMSNRVMNIISSTSEKHYCYSIDEIFTEVGYIDTHDLNSHGKEIIRKVLRGTGIPVSVGYAPTMTLSKLANRIAKKFPAETENIYIINTEEKRIKAVKWLKIEDIWGVGRQNTKKLNAIGVTTAYQFTQLPDDWVKKNMTINGLQIKKELEGIKSLQFEQVKNKKNIGCTRSFEKMLDRKEDIQERISTFTGSLAEKLRAQKSHTNMIGVFLQTNHFRNDLPKYNPAVWIPTDYPTNSTIELINTAKKALDIIYKPGYCFKRAGVMVTELTPESSYQMNFFTGENPKHQDIMKVIDRINSNSGNKIIRFAGQSMGKVWKMKQERLSPNYTTKISDIITVNCKE